MLYWVLTPLSILFMFILIILFIPIKIHMRYAHHQKDDLLTVYVYFLKIKLYTLNVPIVQFNASTQTVTVEEDEKTFNNASKKKKKWGVADLRMLLKKARRFAAHFPKMKQSLNRFLSKLTFKHVTWKTEFGTGDAATTAQVAGLIWTIKTCCLGWIQAKVRWDGEHKLEVTPHFQAKGYRLFLSCIVTFTLWHAIVTMLLFLFSYKKVEKRFNQATSA
ncbi:DUF2953 domain-containing protein [Shouchella sp. 1P09AA]|uniref:DUF2953 domain-containing protein n=1 Tax=unclassified Shouchella TaxID=2893065 RepID=UPI00399F385C